LLAFIVIQLFRPSKDNNSTAASLANINNFCTVPSDIDQALKSSCYDCHSNKTNYPWYSSVQPIGWWLESHIKEGKKELNFDEFGNYPLRRKYHKMEEIGEMVDEDEMPLSSYTLIHTSSKLSPEQKRQLVIWSEQIRSDMKARYPIDSLIKPKK
jgi:hypothetical protein